MNWTSQQRDKRGRMDFEAMDAEDTPVIEITMMLSICPFIF